MTQNVKTCELCGVRLHGRPRFHDACAARSGASAAPAEVRAPLARQSAGLRLARLQDEILKRGLTKDPRMAYRLAMKMAPDWAAIYSAVNGRIA